MGKKGARVKVADRLAEILLSLYQGETLSADIIRRRFDVDMRTAYRDLNRLGAILEDIGEGRKRLSGHLIGQTRANELLSIPPLQHGEENSPCYKINDYFQLIRFNSNRGFLSEEDEEGDKVLNQSTLYSSFRLAPESKKTEAHLLVAASVAVHFKDCNLLPYQRIIDELDNGDLLLSSLFDSPEELFPFVQCWIPHLTILTPQVWHQDLKERVSAWCNRI